VGPVRDRRAAGVTSTAYVLEGRYDGAHVAGSRVVCFAEAGCASPPLSLVSVVVDAHALRMGGTTTTTRGEATRAPHKSTAPPPHRSRPRMATTSRFAKAALSVVRQTQPHRTMPASFRSLPAPLVWKFEFSRSRREAAVRS
jgi:hypothetical protein